MSANDHNAIESQLQGLLGQLKAAEAALRAGMHTHGFGCTARAHGGQVNRGSFAARAQSAAAISAATPSTGNPGGRNGN